MMEYIGFKEDGRFVEVGAFDGKQWSNTWGLAKLGWSGIMFEPNPEYFEQCVINHSDNNVAVFPLAVSDNAGMTKLYLGGSLSTIRPDMVEVYGSMQWSSFVGLDRERFIEVPVTTLDIILEACSWRPSFELLVIDVEGAELEVLSAFDIEIWDPAMVVIETHEKFPEQRISYKYSAIAGRFDFHGYKQIYGDTINSVFVRT